MLGRRKKLSNHTANPPVAAITRLPIGPDTLSEPAKDPQAKPEVSGSSHNSRKRCVSVMVPRENAQKKAMRAAARRTHPIVNHGQLMVDLLCGIESSPHSALKKARHFMCTE